MVTLQDYVTRIQRFFVPFNIHQIIQHLKKKYYAYNISPSQNALRYWYIMILTDVPSQHNKGSQFSP